MLAGGGGKLPLEGIFFATRDDQPVGAACVFLYPGEGGTTAELGWVVAHPLHRGSGLGMLACRAVLSFVRDLRFPYAYLMTEDYRLPAIAMYLCLGFEPEIVDPSHLAWWAALRQTMTGEEWPR